MSIGISSAGASRMPMPETKFGKKLTKVLYDRFHSTMNKAKARNNQFSWQNFTDYLHDLDKVAPIDFHPDTHRVSYDLSGDKEKLGYCRETMRVLPIKSRSATISALPSKPKAYLSEAERLAFMAEMTRMMIGDFEGSLDEMIEEAKARIGVSG